MKTEKIVIVLALVLGLLIWVVDAVVDYFIFTREGSFWGLLTAADDVHEIYMRCVILAVLLTFGFVVSRKMSESRKTAEALQQSEQRYRMLVETMTEGLGMSDADGNVTYVNPAMTRMLGYSEAEVIGRHLNDFLDEANRAIMQKELAKRRKGEEEAYEIEWTRRDGTKLPAMMSPRPLFDDDGRYQGAFAVVTDITQRKLAEEALRESEERFRDLFENAPLAYQSLDEQGNFLELNETWCKTLGYTKEEVLGRNFSEFIHPDFREHFKENFPKFKSMRYILGVEFEMIRKDGSEIIVAFDGRIGHKADGSFKQTHCILKDVTRHKQAEEELHQAHEELEHRVQQRTAELNAANERLALFERFVEASGEGMGWADLNGNVRYINPALCRMFGEARPEDAYGKPVLQYYDEPTQRKIQEEAFPAVLQESGWTGDMVVHSIKGTSIPTSNSLVALRDPKGEPIGFANVLTDLTERKRHEEQLQKHRDHLEDLIAERTAELEKVNRELQEEIAERKRAGRALRESEQRYRSVYDTAPLAFVIWDLQYRVNGWNDHAEKIFGWPREEIAGKNFFEFLIPDDSRPRVQDIVETLLHGEIERDVINENLTKSGDKITCQWNNSILRDATGNPVAVLSLALDITERRRVEAEREKLIGQLEAQNAELERFTYTVSHDLKSPLITLKGYLGLLKEDLAGEKTEAIEDDMSRMAGAADKMERLLEELLELSRIGRVVNPPQHVSLGELAREAVELVGGRIAEGRVQVEIAPDLPVVFGDRPRLLEVLQNLVDNAVKYMGTQSEPRVEIGARLGGEETVCYIRDNGMGIVPRYHEKIFGLFDQLDPRAEGSGIGLALVKRIVEVHGGRIWVESEGRASSGQARGSTFCFTLPPADKRVTPGGKENER